MPASDFLVTHLACSAHCSCVCSPALYSELCLPLALVSHHVEVPPLLAGASHQSQVRLALAAGSDHVQAPQEYERHLCQRSQSLLCVLEPCVKHEAQKKNPPHTKHKYTQNTYLLYIYIYRKISGKQYFCSMLAGSNVEQHNDVQ
jgi:hypothetical protein